MENIEYNIDFLNSVCSSLGEPKFRAKQLQSFLFSYENFRKGINLPEKFFVELSKNYNLKPVSIHSKFESTDGTVKYVLKLSDNNIIECVLMQYNHGKTLCVSTQVGCRMNCAFCASGLDGLVRNLTATEIVGEVLAVNADLGGKTGDKRAITNIVLMGSGEPLDNYDNVKEFLRIISLPECLNISGRNISLSTCGIVPKIYQLIEDKISVVLTLSLHAGDDETRNKIMPISKAYSFEETTKAFLTYVQKMNRRGIVEYSLIEGVNDNVSDIQKLVKVFKNKNVHFNVIRLNSVPERGLNGTSNNKAHIFCRALESAGLSATLRRIMGEDVEGACGQLRRRVLKDENNANN